MSVFMLLAPARCDCLQLSSLAGVVHGKASCHGLITTVLNHHVVAIPVPITSFWAIALVIVQVAPSLVVIVIAILSFVIMGNADGSDGSTSLVRDCKSHGIHCHCHMMMVMLQSHVGPTLCALNHHNRRFNVGS